MSLFRVELPALHLSIVNDPANTKIIRAGRRWGKTELVKGAICKHLAKPIVNHKTGRTLNHEIGYYAPTYTQAKEVFWRRIKAALKPLIKKANESDLTIEFINGGRLKLFGTDQDPDKLRGTYKSLVILDEWAFHKQGVYEMVIRPMLADVEGETLALSTPNGYNHFFDYCNRPNTDNFKTWHFKSVDGGFVSWEWVEAEKANMDEITWQQEFLAEFVGRAGRVCYSWSDMNIDDTLQYYDDQTLYVTCDFNIDPMCWEIAHHLDGDFQFIDEIAMPDAKVTTQVAHELGKRYRGHKGRIILTGDASGKNRSTQAPGPDKTNYVQIQNTLKEYGLKDVHIDIPKGNPEIKARVDHWNTLVCSADGVRRIKVHPKCEKLIWNMDNLVWVAGGDKIKTPTAHEIATDKTNLLKFTGHPFDAASYLPYRKAPPRRIPEKRQQGNLDLDLEFFA